MLSGLDAFMRARKDRMFSLAQAAQELGAEPGEVSQTLGELASSGESGVYDIGNGSYIFTNDKDLAAYRVFKTVSPFITRDEWQRHKNNLPYLDLLSRQREVASPALSFEEMKKVLER